jgi:hypothetical protein
MSKAAVTTICNARERITRIVTSPLDDALTEAATYHGLTSPTTIGGPLLITFVA